MIDTIVLRIHNIDKYPQLYAQYIAPSKKRKTVSEAWVDEDIIKSSKSNKVHAFIYHDTDKFLPITCRSSIGLPSSHYEVLAAIRNNYLEFNFSIPKYLYGNNVMQFINMGDQSAHVCYLELKKFLYGFIKSMCMYQEPIPEDVEINRIDFCYNQLFNSKNDALQYLDEQNVINKKLARASKNKGRNYESESLTYNTRRYGWKIYHKGKEFRKNDLNKIAKKNKKDLPLEYIAEIADRTLRYEMTFRKSMIKYLCNQYFFVSGQKQLYPQYSEHKLTKFCKKLITYEGVKAYERFQNFEKKFTLKSLFDYTNDLYLLSNTDSITFDETIFTICFNTFWDKVKQYQIDKAFDIGSIINAVDKHNSEVDLKNHYRRKPLSGHTRSRIIISALLAQYMPGGFEKFREFLPPTTFKTLRTDLKKIGINTTDSKNLTFPKPRMDYFDYKLAFLQLHNKY